jgi:hypothetical protein
VSSDTTLLALVLAVVIHPDRVSPYFEGGMGTRWYGFAAKNPDGSVLAHSYVSLPEGLFGVGLSIPVDPRLRLLPKVTLTLASFEAPDCGGCWSIEHAFIMFNLAGLYDIDL